MFFSRDGKICSCTQIVQVQIFFVLVKKYLTYMVLQKRVTVSQKLYIGYGVINAVFAVVVEHKW